MLHSKHIDITDALVQLHDTSISCQSILYDEVDETVKIVLHEEIRAGELIDLVITYSGHFKDNFEGFYQTEYTDDDGKTHNIAATALEPTYARQVFPCFDEPHLKATFVVSAVVDPSFMCFSNMPVAHSEIMTESRKLVVFQETPPMSTYLLALVAGHLAQVRSTTGRIPISVICRVGREECAEFALDLASRGLGFFETLFGCLYPLPKLDLAAIPECANSGLENWGLITFKEINLLLDHDDSALDRKRFVAETVLHEVAHMWFGDLVTMRFWDGLWLKEGFATLMAWIGMNEFFPDWKIWDRYVANDLQAALALDSLRSSHPVERIVRDPKDAKQMYDEISYQKGCCVLKMVSNEFGDEKFMEGVKLYIRRFQFESTQSEDLWAVLEDHFKAPIRQRMEIWTKKVGFPVVRVQEEMSADEDDGDKIIALRLTQSRFNVGPSEKGDAQVYPLRISIRFETCIQVFDMAGETLTIPVPGGSRWAKINANHDGFFISAYTPSHLRQLLEAASKDELTVRDCVGLSCDLRRLVVAGINKTSDLLDLIARFRHIDTYLVWETIDQHLRTLQEAFKFQSFPAVEGIRKLTEDLMGSMARSRGWDLSGGDDTSVLFKSMLFSSAGLVGDEKVIRAANQMFTKRLDGDEHAILPSLRYEVFGVVAAHGGRHELEGLLEIWNTSKNDDEKYLALECLGRTRDLELIRWVLDLAFTDQVGGEDLFIMLWLVGSNANGAIEIWEWAKKNWDKLVEIVPTTLRPDTFKLLIQGLNTMEQIADVKAFFSTRDTTDFNVALARKLEEMETTRRWVERDADDTSSWLSSHGYLEKAVVAKGV